MAERTGEVVQRFNILRGVYFSKRFTLKDLAESRKIPIDVVRDTIDQLVGQGIVFEVDANLQQSSKSDFFAVIPKSEQKDALKEKIQEIRRSHFPDLPTQRTPHNAYYLHAINMLDIIQGRNNSPAEWELKQIDRELILLEDTKVY